ncbi:hypothetical protein GCM10009736_52070 [Actinomadura bangladeshensis]
MACSVVDVLNRFGQIGQDAPAAAVADRTDLRRGWFRDTRNRVGFPARVSVSLGRRFGSCPNRPL